jgi:hypothetical protein
VGVATTRPVRALAPPPTACSGARPSRRSRTARIRTQLCPAGRVPAVAPPGLRRSKRLGMGTRDRSAPVEVGRTGISRHLASLLPSDRVSVLARHRDWAWLAAASLTRNCHQSMRCMDVPGRASSWSRFPRKPATASSGRSGGIRVSGWSRRTRSPRRHTAHPPPRRSTSIPYRPYTLNLMSRSYACRPGSRLVGCCHAEHATP